MIILGTWDCTSRNEGFTFDKNWMIKNIASLLFFGCFSFVRDREAVVVVLGIFRRLCYDESTVMRSFALGDVVTVPSLPYLETCKTVG